MSIKTVYALSSVLIGDIASDGGMGTTLTEILGATVEGSAKLMRTPPTIEDIPEEESDLPVASIETTPAKWEFELESSNVSALALSKFIDGTYTAGTAGSPDTFEPDTTSSIKEMSFKVTTRNGAVIDIVRMRVSIGLDLTFTRKGIGKLSLKGSVMTPKKAGVKPLKLTDGN